MREERKRLIGPHPLLMFIILTIPYFLVYIHRTTGGAISDILQDFYGVGTASVALLASSYLYAYMIMQVPAGLLTDRIGPRKCIFLSLIAVALGTALCAFSATVSDFNLMLVGKALIGLCAAFFVVPTLKAIAMWFSKERFATADGVFMFVGNIGSIVAAAPMVIMLENVGITNTYVLLSILFLLTSFICWFMIHDNAGRSSVDVQGSRRYGSMESLRIILTSGRRFWALALVALFVSCSMVWSASQAGAFYCSVYDFSLEDAGLMVSLYAIGFAAGCPLAGLLADYVFRSRKKVLMICTASTTFIWAIILLMTCFRLFDGVLIQGVINFAFGISTGLEIIMYSQVRCLFPLEIAGTSLSMMNVFPFLGGATAILLSGFFISNKTAEEYTIYWGIMLLCCIIAFLLSLISVEEKYGSPEDR